MPVIVDVLATDYHDQLYQRYAALRDEHPVYFDASRNIWMITRYEDVRRLLRHPDGTLNGSTGHSYIPTLATSDGELHNKVRSHVIPMFSKAVATQLEPVIARIVDECFARLPTSGEIDLYHEVIKCIPQEFMTRFLGFPEGSAPLWYALGDILMGQDPQDDSPTSAEVAIRDLDAVATMVQAVLAEKRRNPGNDHLTWLVQQEAQGLLTPEESTLFANCLTFAGVDTTINLLQHCPNYDIVESRWRLSHWARGYAALVIKA